MERESGLPICYCLHDDHWHLAASMRSFKRAGHLVAFISRVAWDGTTGDWQKCVEIAEAEGAEVILGDWNDEQIHRQSALAMLRDREYSYVLVPDGDEIIAPELLDKLLTVAAGNLADRVYVEMATYWKTPQYVIQPPEQLSPLIMLNLEKVRHVYIREYEGGTKLKLDAGHSLLHHLSYTGSDERIKRKTSCWGHRAEVLNGWIANKWTAWDQDKLLTNLHPTHPEAYGFTERVPLSPVLKAVGIKEDDRPGLDPPAKWPTVSVVIPLCGGSSDIQLCLESLEKCGDLIHEVVVVDNASSDGADKVAESFRFVKLIRNETNEGFAKASNQGYEASTGEVILFLNSDTVVARSALIRLIESLMAAGSVAAAGPHSNRVFGPQQILPTYTCLENYGLFAEDFAERPVPDREVDMLVGFCLAVKRSILEEVGCFDESFGLGTFEDNDLCYRIRRAGYKLLIASRSYVHHGGSKTLLRMPSHPAAQLRKNQRIFIDKWSEDLRAGFVSHLPGLSPEPVRFDPERAPEARRQRIELLRKRADISLCMIVKNEERVLGDCLRSVQPFFNQIVVVDTGSDDRTREIAKEFGAEVHEFPWTDSFADARNESMKHAKGRWLFWVDADDTLPWESGEAILSAALNSPAHIGGYVVPVQFVEGGVAAGTRVDHVKLIRNTPGLLWEGRIHEQILGSIRAQGGEIARLNAVVLHSGYDVSELGQKRKRERDWKLLDLDVKERPDHPFVLFNLAMTAHYTDRHEEAIDWVGKSLAASAPDESHVRKAYALWAGSLQQLGRTEESLAVLMKGLDLVGHDGELHFQAGRILTEMGRLEEAKQHYLLVAEDDRNHFSSVDTGIFGSKRSFNLGSVCRLMGDLQGARDWWGKCIEADRAFFPAYAALFDLALEMTDFRYARQVLDLVQGLPGASDEWTKMGIRLTEASVGPDAVEPFLERARENNPLLEAPALALARMHLVSGREDVAWRELEALERLGSAEGAYLLGICATGKGRYPLALQHMEIAEQLNPGHVPTLQHIEKLRVAISAMPQGVMAG